MRIAILQSNYIPWKGYFDLINRVDEFIILDQVQFTKNDWRNRNRIKTQEGVTWISIPVRQDHLRQTILETRVADPRWAMKHWKTVSQSYARARHFKTYADVLEKTYREIAEFELLSQINLCLIRTVCELTGMRTRITSSTAYTLEGTRVERLVKVCQQAGATTYLSGPSAKSYLDVNAFSKAGISVEWMNYEGYPEYEQLFPPFAHDVSILDLLFNVGPDFRRFMKSFSGT